MRFVVSPDNRVVPDIKGTLPGKGIWVQPRADLLHDACRRNLFSKAAKRKVTVDENLTEIVEKLLKERVFAYLNRARLAGELVNGTEKVLSLLKSGEAAVLIHASDAADDGSGKLNKHAQNMVILRFGNREALAEILNLPNPVHLAIKRGGIAKAFLQAHSHWQEFVKN